MTRLTFVACTVWRVRVTVLFSLEIECAIWCSLAWDFVIISPSIRIVVRSLIRWTNMRTISFTYNCVLVLVVGNFSFLSITFDALRNIVRWNFVFIRSIRFIHQMGNSHTFWHTGDNTFNPYILFEFLALMKRKINQRIMCWLHI